MPYANSVASQSVRTSPLVSIQRASEATGVDFEYLVSQAEIESSMNPNARAGTSSAAGLFQFTQQTWLATVKKHGHKAGMEWAQDAIQRDKNGAYFVADPKTRKIILDLRFEPEPASRMAAFFALDNRDHLRARLGIEPTSTDLYLAHFLGSGGAVKFLSERAKNPNATAASLFPEAAAANRNIFYTKSGAPRSLEQVYALFHDKLDQAGDKWVPGGFFPDRQPVMFANAPMLGITDDNSSIPTDPFGNPIAMGGFSPLSSDGSLDGLATIANDPMLAAASLSPGVGRPFDPNAMGPPSPAGRKSGMGQEANGRSPSTMDALAAIRFEPMPSRLSIDFARTAYSRLAQV